MRTSGTKATSRARTPPEALVIRGRPEDAIPCWSPPHPSREIVKTLRTVPRLMIVEGTVYPIMRRIERDQACGVVFGL